MKKAILYLMATLLLCSACAGPAAPKPGGAPDSIISDASDDSTKAEIENREAPQTPQTPSQSPQPPLKPSPSPQPTFSNDYPDKLVFNNKPLIAYLLLSAADVRHEFGAAVFDGAGPHAYLLEYSGFEIFLPFDEWRGERDVVTGIRIYDPGLLSVNGVTLDRDLSVIRTALGEPDYEGWEDYDGDEAYTMQYLLWEAPAPMLLDLYTDGPGGNVLNAAIHFYDDGPYPEPPPWQEPYVYPSLILTDAIQNSTSRIQIVISWIDGRTTSFERTAGSDNWIMHNGDGSGSTVYPTFPDEIGIITISFPTTNKLYFLYDNLTGEFRDESFEWDYTIG